MSKGRKNQLTKQIGEYLVAAELGRRGFLATTFTGNVPHYDVLAAVLQCAATWLSLFRRKCEDPSSGSGRR